jgi:hypothetical protein
MNKEAGNPLLFSFRAIIEYTIRRGVVMWNFWKRKYGSGSQEFSELTNYVVNTEADGKMSKDGLFQSSHSQIKHMIRSIIHFFKTNPGPNRLVFYCHGGLVSERVAGEAIKARYQTFLQNQVYPVFFIWQSSFVEALMDHLKRMVDSRFSQASAVNHVVDEIIEEAAKLFPQPWEAMKRRGEQVFATHGAGWKFLLLLARTLRREQLQAEVHLVGHSAGSIVLQTLLKQLMERNCDVYPYLRINGCTLYAPASTVDQFESVYAKSMDNYYLRRFFLYTLSDELEREDTSVPYYNKSILYLISRGLEGQKGDQSIFGMEMYAKQSPSLKRFLEEGKAAWILAAKESRPVFFPVGEEILELKSLARQHGGFSYDPATLNSTMKTVIHRNRLYEEFR